LRLVGREFAVFWLTREAAELFQTEVPSALIRGFFATAFGRS
jgi:hypothetical protein